MTPYMEMKLMAEAGERRCIELRQQLAEVTNERDIAIQGALLGAQNLNAALDVRDALQLLLNDRDAEVDRLKEGKALVEISASQVVKAKGYAESELTKTRELLIDIRGANAAYALQKIDIYLAHQSAPAALNQAGE